MIYLIGEMIFWLLAAAALGFLAAWLIRGALGSDRAAGESASEWSAKMTASEAGFEARTAAAEAALARAKADLHAANNKVALHEGDGARRTAELESGLKVQLRAAEALAAERGATVEQLRVAVNSANTQWMNRLADAEQKAARLADELDEAKEALAALPPAPAATPADEGARAALDREILALKARIAELEALPPAPSLAAKPARKARPEPPPGEDDLQTISGLGPVMEKTLKARGITTYRALAALTQDDAKRLGTTARNNVAAWIDQARAQHEAKYGEAL